MSQPQTPNKFPEPKIIRRLTQWAPDPSSENKERASMTYAIKGSNIELLVWTRGPMDKSKPPIKANMSVLQVYMLCDMIDQVAASAQKDIKEFPLNYERSTDPNNKDAKRELYEQSLIRVVKNSEGLMSIGLFDPKDDTRSRILFPFILDRWTGIVKSNGQPLDLSEVSCMVARSYARILREVTVQHIEATTNEENQSRYGDRTAPKKPYNQQKPQQSSQNLDTFTDITY